MSVVCENNIWEIWLHKCKINKVNNAMHVLIYMCNACESNHKWCMTRLIGQEPKNWNFRVSIGQKSIRHQSNQAESFGLKIWLFWSVKGIVWLIEQWKIFKLEKSRNFCRKNNLKAFFMICIAHEQDPISFKNIRHSNPHFKTIQEVKITKLKLLKQIFLQIPNENTKKKKLHNKFYAIKDDQTR